MSNHLKRYMAPTTWAGILRKQYAYIVKPAAGPHAMRIAMPIAVWLRQLGTAQTRREARKILNTQPILVDGRRIKDLKFPVGFQDVLSIGDDHYRVKFNALGHLELVHIKEHTKLKPCKITGKTIVTGGKTQLNLSDSRNLLVDKGDYKVGDTVVLEVPNQKITKHLKLDKEASIVLIGGKHIGDKGVIVDIKGQTLVYKKDKQQVQTLKKYAYVLSEEYA